MPNQINQENAKVCKFGPRHVLLVESDDSRMLMQMNRIFSPEKAEKKIVLLAVPVLLLMGFLGETISMESPLALAKRLSKYNFFGYLYPSVPDTVGFTLAQQSGTMQIIMDNQVISYIPEGMAIAVMPDCKRNIWD